MLGHKINKLWQESGGDDLLGGWSFQDLFGKLVSPDQAFKLSDRNLRCIDEGTVGGIHLAGAGVLYPKAAQDFTGQVTGVFSHQGCGAVKLHATSLRITTDDLDMLADEEAKKMAQMLRVPFLGRIADGQLKRPPEIHVARAVYYDGTGHFDPSKLSLPAGFVVSRRYISDPAYAQSEVEIAVKIAHGNHGFGELFTADSPFYLVAVTDPQNGSISLGQLVKELSLVASKHNFVKVDHITNEVEPEKEADGQYQRAAKTY